MLCPDDEETKEPLSPQRPHRRQSLRTPAVNGLKHKLTAIKKTYFLEDEARPLALQLISALEKIHRLGIVHRDLNPSNIFLHFPSFPKQESPTTTFPLLQGKLVRILIIKPLIYCSINLISETDSPKVDDP